MLSTCDGSEYVHVCGSLAVLWSCSNVWLNLFAFIHLLGASSDVHALLVCLVCLLIHVDVMASPERPLGSGGAVGANEKTKAQEAKKQGECTTSERHETTEDDSFAMLSQATSKSAFVVEFVVAQLIQHSCASRFIIILCTLLSSTVISEYWSGYYHGADDA